MKGRISILGRPVNIIEDRAFDEIASGLSQFPNQSAYFCNVHMLMLSQEDRDLAVAMGKADFVFADGVPVAWLQKRLSGKNARVVRGYEVMLAACKHAVAHGERVGFLGSTEIVMQNLVDRLCDQFEGLEVAYQYCPPLVDGDVLTPPDELQAIKHSGIQWLFIGLGCPKQEKWVARYKDDLDCHVLAVGAAFDWLSGMTRKPPAWMERFALGWFHRLATNPMQMWRRYLIYNTKFLARVPAELYRNWRVKLKQTRNE